MLPFSLLPPSLYVKLEASAICQNYLQENIVSKSFVAFEVLKNSVPLKIASMFKLYAE
jgi:hypothetical protein